MEAREAGMPATRWTPTVSRLGALAALALCFVAGYVVAVLWSSGRDTNALAQICARVDYVNGLQENLKGQDPATEEVSVGLKGLVEQCRTALRNLAEENDWVRWCPPQSGASYGRRRVGTALRAFAPPALADALNATASLLRFSSRAGCRCRLRAGARDCGVLELDL